MIPSANSAFTVVSRDPLAGAVENLKTRQGHLQESIRRLLSQYGDAAVNENVQEIRAILEKAIHDVMQRIEKDTRPLWRETMRMLEECLALYEKQLDQSAGRRSLRQLQHELEQVTALIAKTSEKSVAAMDEDALDCCVCFDARVNVSMKCGHLLCDQCVQSVDRCPTCRQWVRPEDIRPVYF